MSIHLHPKKDNDSEYEGGGKPTTACLFICVYIFQI